jgi:hypothetical protein
LYCNKQAISFAQPPFVFEAAEHSGISMLEKSDNGG